LNSGGGAVFDEFREEDETMNELESTKEQIADSRRVSFFSLLSQIGVIGKQMIGTITDYLRYAEKYDLPNQTPNEVDEIEQKRRTGRNAANAFMWIAIIGAVGLTYLTLASGLFHWVVIVGILVGLAAIIVLSECGLAESGFIALSVDPMEPASIRIVRWFVEGAVAVFVGLLALFLLSRIVQLPWMPSLSETLIVMEFASIVLYALCREYEKFHAWQFRLATLYRSLLEELARCLGRLAGYSALWRSDGNLKKTAANALEFLKEVQQAYVLVPAEFTSSTGEDGTPVLTETAAASVGFGEYAKPGQRGSEEGDGKFHN
jgi:hypothetical protein